MKYKSKFSIAGNGIKVEENQIFDDNNQSGKLVFIPFSDTRFFEPVKTRKFVVEVPEENMEKFNFYVNDGDPAWIVTEITESEYLIKLKANPEVSDKVIQVMSDYENLVATHAMFLTSYNKHGKNYKLSVVKDMKYFLDNRFPQIGGLKNAKDIVDSFWNF